MPSLISCLLAGLAVADRAAAVRYSLSKTYDSSNFLDEFHFRETDTIRTQQDGNWAWVKYQNVKDAVDKGIASVKDNKVYLGVDSETKLENNVDGPRRASLHVQSKESFREGLVITRFYHMPKPVCGGWPAYWTLGENAPLGGRIEMYRVKGLNRYNTPAIQVAPKRTVGECYIQYEGEDFASGDLDGADCNAEFYNWDWQGCSWVEPDDVDIVGSSNGGIQALEWTEDTIKLYTWQIGKEPKNIDSKNLDTSSWGVPSMQLTSPGCDTSTAFGNQTILFTLRLCDRPPDDDWVWELSTATGKVGETCKKITGAETCIEHIAGNPEAFKGFYFGINDVRIFVQDAEENDDNNNTKGQLSLDDSSPSLTFTYATSQSSSDNWIGLWPEDDTQAPTWNSTTWDYARESSGSLQLTPPSSMKAGKYKAYLLSSDRTILAFLSSFDYKPESSSSSSSVAFSVKTHYNTNCGGSVNNNVDIKPGNGVCVRTNCDVGSLEIPSVGSCPDGQVRISYWQNADCGGDWYGYGYGSRGTCRGLWSNGWGFKSLWMSCADLASDCMQQGTCIAAPEPATEVCRAATKPDASLIG